MKIFIISYGVCVCGVFLQADPDVQMVNSYELALTTGKTFLSTFMKKLDSHSHLYTSSDLSLSSGVVGGKRRRISDRCLITLSRTCSPPSTSQNGQPVRFFSHSSESSWYTL